MPDNSAIVRALDQTGDWTFGGGTSNYLINSSQAIMSNNSAVGQQIRCRLLEFSGNCFWNPQAGLDWKTLLGQRNNQQLINLQAASVISNTPGVTFLQQLNVNLNRNTRQLTITWVVTTVYSVFSSSFSTTIPQPVGG